MAKKKQPRKKCSCNAKLPNHLLDLVDDRFSHVCICERKWRVVNRQWVQDGTASNPFAQR